MILPNPWADLTSRPQLDLCWGACHQDSWVPPTGSTSGSPPASLSGSAAALLPTNSSTSTWVWCLM